MHTTCKFILFFFRWDFSLAQLLSVGLRYDNLPISFCVFVVVVLVVDSLTAPLQLLLLLIDFWSLVVSISSANGAVGYGDFDVGMDAGIGPQMHVLDSLVTEFGTHFCLCTLLIVWFVSNWKFVVAAICLLSINSLVYRYSPIRINYTSHLRLFYFIIYFSSSVLFFAYSMEVSISL